MGLGPISVKTAVDAREQRLDRFASFPARDAAHEVGDRVWCALIDVLVPFQGLELAST